MFLEEGDVVVFSKDGEEEEEEEELLFDTPHSHAKNQESKQLIAARVG